MSCDPFVFNQRGREGIGVIQPQSGLDYPFVAPSSDIRYLLADFYFSYDDPAEYNSDLVKVAHPLRIHWLYGVGCEDASVSSDSGGGITIPQPTHAADLLIVDKNNKVVFDSTQADEFNTRDWGGNYRIYEWLTDKEVCRLTAYTTWAPAEDSPQNYPIEFLPENATLDERAVYRLPKRVLSMRVRNGSFVLPKITGSDIQFVAGNNFQLTTGNQAIVGSRRQTAITLAAVPGAGDGKYVDCEDPDGACGQPIGLLNGAAPNEHGDLLIAGNSCLWIRVPTVLNEDGTAVSPKLRNTVDCTGEPGQTKVLQIGTNCAACCDCEDYETLARYMNRTRDRYKKIGKRAHNVKLLHEDNIDRWIAQRQCRLAKPLKIQIVPQHCPFVDIVLQYCNQCFQCAKNVRLSVTMSAFPATPTGYPMCGFTFLYGGGVPGKGFNINGTWPTFSANIGDIDIGSSTYVKFRLKMLPNDYPYSITGTLTGTIDGNPIKQGCDDTYPVAVATAVDALFCDEDGNTTLPCVDPAPPC